MPVLCFADFAPGPNGQGDTVDLGELTERCNAAGGYQIFVNYPPGVTGVALIVDGRSVALDGSGRTLLVDASDPSIRVRHVLAQVEPGGPPPGSIPFQFEDPRPKP